jgi:uncharacterized repeat protein (TIGR01451 family)
VRTPRRPPVALARALALLAVLAPGLPAAGPAAAQEAPAPTLTLAASAPKARVGDFVTFTVRVANPGAAAIPDLSVQLGLPDALDARAVDCPGETSGIVTFCALGDVAPGAGAEVRFAVEVGTRARAVNGPVTASAGSGGAVLAEAALPPLKIVGPRPR